MKRDEVESFDCYPFSIPAVRNLRTLELHPKVTYFVGDNGTGKSTLLEAIAIAMGFNAEGGTRNFNFVTRATHSSLHNYLMLGKGIKRPSDNFFLRAETFYNVATAGEEYGSLSGYHQKSHGEAFLTLLSKRFSGNGLYILDEPEAALSPLRQMAVLSVMHNLIQRQSQFIIVTHSPIIMAYPDSTIYLFSDDAITPIDYEETEHYTVTMDFLNRRKAMLNVLLRDEEQEN